MRISMIGTGYVGLVSGACFADLGNTVWCVDSDNKKIDKLNNNEIPIFEPGLKELVNKNFLSDRLKFTTDLNFAVKNSAVKHPYQWTVVKLSFNKCFEIFFVLPGVDLKPPVEFLHTTFELIVCDFHPFALDAIDLQSVCFPKAELLNFLFKVFGVLW